MRKHFLILMLMALLPLTGWAEAITPVMFTVSDVQYGTAPTVTSTTLEQGSTKDYVVDANYYANANGGAIPASSYSKSGHLKVGTYYVKIEGVNNYSGILYRPFVVSAKEITATFTVAAITFGDEIPAADDLYAHTLAGLEDNGLTGEDKVTDDDPVASIKYGTTGTETTVLRDENGDVIGYPFTATSNDPNYTVKCEGTFKINPKSLPSYSTTAYKYNKATSYTYSGLVQAPTFTVKDGTTDISDQVEVEWYTELTKSGDPLAIDGVKTSTKVNDGTIDYGTYYAVLKGKGNYTGTVNSPISGTAPADVWDWQFTIAKKRLYVYVDDANLTKTYDAENIDLSKLKVLYSGIVTRDGALSANNFNNTVSVAMNGASETTGVVKTNGSDVASYAVIPSATGASTITNNYDPQYQEAIYTITKRNVTVTALKQTKQYTGSALSVSATETLYDETPEADNSAATVRVERAVAATGGGYTTNTGWIEGHPAWNNGGDNDFDDFFTITKNSSVTLKDVKVYPGAVEIKKRQTNTGTTAAPVWVDNTGNYNIICVAGDFEVTGMPLVIAAKSFEKEYGYVVDDDDLNVITFPNNAGIKAGVTPEFEIYKDGVKVEDLSNPLPVGVYQIQIKHNSELAPGNYTIDDITGYEAGDLNITKKAVNVEINTVALNQGATKTTLNTYGSYKDYTSQLIGDEEIAFELKFVAGVTGANYVNDTDTPNNKITLTGTNGLTNTVAADTYVAAIDGELLTGDKKKDNDNYLITFTKGTLKILGATDLFMDENDPDMADRIKNAALACADEPTLQYNVSFSSRELKREVWAPMVLPFETSVKEISDILNYAVVDILDESTTSNDMHLKLHMGKIEANQPFIVKYYMEDVEDDPSTPAVDESEDNSTYDFATAAAGFGGKSIVYDVNADYVNEDGNVFVENANSGHQFIGVYNPVQVYGAEYKWISKKGELVDGSKYTEDKKAPMRRLIAYFKLNNPASARILIDEPDGTTTVINAVTAETMNVQAEGWYTLNGVKLQGVPTQKGIYINNGKKVVIK